MDLNQYLEIMSFNTYVIRILETSLDNFIFHLLLHFFLGLIGKVQNFLVKGAKFGTPHQNIYLLLHFF